MPVSNWKLGTTTTATNVASGAFDFVRRPTLFLGISFADFLLGMPTTSAILKITFLLKRLSRRSRGETNLSRLLFQRRLACQGQIDGKFWSAL